MGKQRREPCQTAAAALLLFCPAAARLLLLPVLLALPCSLVGSQAPATHLGAPVRPPVRSDAGHLACPTAAPAAA
jgi:hypothetical protein